MELGELEVAGQATAGDPGGVVSLGLEGGFGAVAVVLHLDDPRVHVVVGELEGVDLGVLGIHKVDRRLSVTCRVESKESLKLRNKSKFFNTSSPIAVSGFGALADI